MTKTEIGMGKMQPFRLSLVGALKALTYDIVELIGKEETIKFKSNSDIIKQKKPPM
jgi:hypothetical protein